MELGRTSPGQVGSDETASTAEPDRDRRQVLAALARFSASVAPMTYVLLDAESAKAKLDCSDHKNPNEHNCIP
ncbi:MAG: hypothetical protein KJZ80_13400 [Hyphomicrobiaceae bacterium]|nr:hypothetical protein [Hyphomicrobiaceae bacterium]